MIDLFLVTCIIVFIIDISGFMDEMEHILGKWLNAKIIIPKPFSCSLCLTWWVGLIYIIIQSNFTIPYIAYVALLSFLTSVIYNGLLLIRDCCNRIIDDIYQFLNIQ